MVSYSIWVGDKISETHIRPTAKEAREAAEAAVEVALAADALFSGVTVRDERGTIVWTPTWRSTE